MADLFWIGDRYGLRHQLVQWNQILNIDAMELGASQLLCESHQRYSTGISLTTDFSYGTTASRGVMEWDEIRTLERILKGVGPQKTYNAFRKNLSIARPLGHGDTEKIRNKKYRNPGTDPEPT